MKIAINKDEDKRIIAGDVDQYPVLSVLGVVETRHIPQGLTLTEYLSFGVPKINQKLMCPLHE